ncbi:hypothetical protein SAMN05421819_3523 [Bryocella elongata]|uniref:Uncharacterized protein n=1 Tax=Bryocella elongata TaxID=863522 RepID=A0A1H6B6M5_9BACT|nr:hypothetical protein [Bryocella elongata]SEG55786.1 hypothetical protein SAMN05421819_3523 [Bryocella elongata]
MRRALPKIAGIVLLASQSVLAAQTNCSETSDPLACHLEQFLHWLHFAAVALGVLLVVVVVVAIRITRRKRNSDDPLFRKETRR